MLLRQQILLETTPKIWSPMPRWENILANIVSLEKDEGVPMFAERGRFGFLSIGRKSKIDLE